MAITYIEQYETKKAVTEMRLPEGKYVIEYVVTGPIGLDPDTVNANISRVDGDQYVRVGYAVYANYTVSIRFDPAINAPIVAEQATISSQFFNDLQYILE